jgi:hypothetical protein
MTIPKKDRFRGHDHNQLMGETRNVTSHFEMTRERTEGAMIKETILSHQNFENSPTILLSRSDTGKHLGILLALQRIYNNTNAQEILHLSRRGLQYKL